MIQNINNTLNINISLDISSNDLNRLCFIGQIMIHEQNEHLEFSPSDFYSIEELRNVNKIMFSPTTSTNNISAKSTLERIERIISELESNDNPMIMERYDIMKFGFMFASLPHKDKLISPDEAFGFFKRLVKLGEIDKTSDTWVTKSGSNNKYHLIAEFQHFLTNYGNGSFGSNATIGSFFHICKEMGIKGYRKIIQ
jgi:hypothetical protein